jgi:AAA15 family ATPase/GTPase
LGGIDFTVKSGASLAPLQVLNASVIHQIQWATPLPKIYCNGYKISVGLGTIDPIYCVGLLLMLHIKNLTIHKFRGLRDLNLQNLGRINLLVGINNSGKTSVLEAISTYCCPLDPLEWLNTARGREIKSSRKPKLDALKWLFPHHNNQNEIIDFYQGETHLSGDGSFPVKESRAIYQEIEGVGESEYLEDEFNFSEDELELENTPIKRGASIELKAHLNDELNDLNSEPDRIETFQVWEHRRFFQKNRNHPRLPVSTVTPFSHRIESLQVELLSEATLHRFKSEVIKLIQTIDSGIIDLQNLPRPGVSSIVYIDHKQLGIAPLSAFGDGVRRLLFIALTLAKIRGGILLIDELETAIHTEALQESFSWLVQWCREMDVQLFATTHSLEAIDALLAATEAEADLVVYRLEPKDSITQALRLDWHRLQRLRQGLGQEVRW